MATRTRPDPTGRAVVIAAVLGSSLVFLDGTTVNVALPALQETLDASVIDVQWVVNGYALFLSALLMLGGSLGDHLGRKRVFMAGIILFTLASVWCGLAADVRQLIAGRALQGVGGALLAPGSLALINANFEQDRRGAAIGTWASFSAIATAAGPILGGWLIDTLSWRWIFFINLPVAALALLISARHVPESKEAEASARLDLVGAGLVTLGLAGLIYALLEGTVRGWADPVIGTTGALGVLLLAAFIAFEGRTEHPMVPLELFRSRVFSGINAVTLLLYLNLAGLGFFLPLFLIQVRGFSATAAGAASLPMVALLFLASGWSGRLHDRVGPKLPVAAGALVTAAALLLFVVLADAPGFLVAVTVPMTVMGAGMALLVAPLTTTVMAAAPDALAGTASGINNAISRVAGLLAIGVLGVVMLSTFAGRLEVELGNAALPAGTQRQMLAETSHLAGMALPEGLTGRQAEQARAAIDAAFTTGFLRILSLMVVLAVLAAALAAVTLPGRDRRASG